MGKRRLKRSGNEQDAFSRYWRSVTGFRPGVISDIKRGYRRRERTRARQELREGKWE